MNNQSTTYICGQTNFSCQMFDISVLAEIDEQQQEVQLDCSNINLTFWFNFTENVNYANITFIQDQQNYLQGDIIYNISFKISKIFELVNTDGIQVSSTSHFEIHKNKTTNVDISSIQPTTIQFYSCKTCDGTDDYPYGSSIQNFTTVLNLTSFDLNIYQPTTGQNLKIDIIYTDYCGRISIAESFIFQIESNNVLVINSQCENGTSNLCSYVTDQQFQPLNFTISCNNSQECFNTSSQNKSYQITIQPIYDQLNLTTLSGTLVLEQNNYTIQINFDNQPNYRVLTDRSQYSVNKEYSIIITNSNNEISQQTINSLQLQRFTFQDSTGANIVPISSDVCSSDVNQNELNYINIDQCTRDIPYITIKSNSSQQITFIQQTCLLNNITLNLTYQFDSESIITEYDQETDTLTVNIQQVTENQIQQVFVSQSQYYLNKSGNGDNNLWTLASRNRQQQCQRQQTTQTVNYLCNMTDFGETQVTLQVSLNGSCDASRNLQINKTLTLQIDRQSWNTMAYYPIQNFPYDNTLTIEFNNSLYQSVNYTYTVASNYTLLSGKISTESGIDGNSSCASVSQQTQSLILTQNECLLIVESNWGGYIYPVLATEQQQINYNTSCNVTNTGYELYSSEPLIVGQSYNLLCYNQTEQKISYEDLTVRDQSSKNYIQTSNASLSVTYCNDIYGCYNNIKTVTIQQNLNVQQNMASIESLTQQQLIAYARQLGTQFNQEGYNQLIQLFQRDKINFPYVYEFITLVQDSDIQKQMYKQGCLQSIKTLINMQYNIEGYNNINQICTQAGNTKILERIYINSLKNVGSGSQYNPSQISKQTQYFNGPNDVDFNGIQISLTQNQSLIVSKAYKMPYAILTQSRTNTQGNTIQIIMPRGNGKYCNIKQVNEMIDDKQVYRLFQSKKQYRNCELINEQLNQYQCIQQGQRSIIWMNYNTKYTPGSYVFMAFSIIGFIVGIICSGILFIRK